MNKDYFLQQVYDIIGMGMAGRPEAAEAILENFWQKFQTELDAVYEEARNEGFDLGYEEGKIKGFDLGYEAGGRQSRMGNT